MIPGALSFNDPRLFESIGCALLYVGTLVGIFLLARDYLGRVCAYVAVVLWGLSELGLVFAESSRARGHPFFYVWMIYWAGKWVQWRDAKYLAIAVVTWALGMYVFLEIAPAIFIIPVVWLAYRPSLTPVPLVLAGVLIAVVWYPYLRFEAKRGFVDLKSQVLRQPIWPDHYENVWCNPSLLPTSWKPRHVADQAQSVEVTRVAESFWWRTVQEINPVWERIHLVATALLVANFTHATNGWGASVALLVITVMGVLVLSLQAFIVPNANISGHKSRWGNALKWFGIVAVVNGMFLNEFTVARYLSFDGKLEPSTVYGLRMLQLVLLVAGTATLALKNYFAAILDAIALAEQNSSTNIQPRGKAKLLVISLVIPWLILLAVTEADRLQRFWWLWPLQIVVLASVVTYVPLQLNLSRIVVWIGTLLLLLLIGANGVILSRIGGWLTDGWSGRDADEVRVVDYLAHRIGIDKKRAAIGYDLYIYRFVAAFNSVDSRYKVGAGFDMLLKHRHGIVNTDRCAEGVSPYDEYRVVQTSSTETAEGALQRIVVPTDNRFYLAQQFGPYQVLQRH